MCGKNFRIFDRTDYKISEFEVKGINIFYIELKCTNSNGEIVLAKKLNHMEPFFLKNYKTCIQKKSYKLFFSRRCSKCSKNEIVTRIVHNFLIKNPNGMNQTFPDRQKYDLWRKNSKNNNFKFFLLPPLPCFELIWV